MSLIVRDGECTLVVVMSCVILRASEPSEDAVVHASLHQVHGHLPQPGRCFVFLNRTLLCHARSCTLRPQLRSKVGVMFGSPDVTSGGNALKFYASGLPADMHSLVLVHPQRVQSLPM